MTAGLAWILVKYLVLIVPAVSISRLLSARPGHEERRDGARPRSSASAIARRPHTIIHEYETEYATATAAPSTKFAPEEGCGEVSGLLAHGSPRCDQGQAAYGHG